MKLAAYNAFCKSLPQTTHVVQWSGSHVWKVGGKVFAIGGLGGEGALAVSFKCSRMTFEMLKGEAGMRLAPYLASRGMSWLQRFGSGALTDAAFKAYLRESHKLVARGLTRKLRAELGLLDE